MTERFAKTPKPPYYAVIFAGQLNGADPGYDKMAQAMFELAVKQPGFLGAESANEADGFGVTALYYADEASILAWKQNAEHLVAQKLGKEKWYEHYEIRVAKVERAYGGP